MYTDGALGGAVDTDLAVGSNQSIVKEKRKNVPRMRERSAEVQRKVPYGDCTLRVAV